MWLTIVAGSRVRRGSCSHPNHGIIPSGHVEQSVKGCHHRYLVGEVGARRLQWRSGPHRRSRVGEDAGMATGDHEGPVRVRSWITPKAVKGGTSAIEGRGVHAIAAIAAGEVVAVKGGHIADGAAVADLPAAIRDSAFQIAADLFLCALTQDEYDGVMMRVNHSCEPN